MASRRVTILIVSAVDMETESLAVLLEEDYVVYQSPDLSYMKDLLAERPIDIVLLNLNSEVEERLRMISYVKNDENYRSILVGVIADGPGMPLGNRAIALGCNYCFRRPMNPARIKRQIDNDVHTFLWDRIETLENAFNDTSRAMALLAAMGLGYVSLYYDEGYFTEYIGANALRLLGYDEHDDLSHARKNVKTMIHPSDYGIFTELLDSIVDGETIHRIPVRLMTPKWDYQRYELSVKGFTVREGVRHYALAIRRLASTETANADLKAEIAIYQENAKIDMLTGIYNKETFFIEASKMIEQNPQQAYVVMIWDIDKFKAINEMFGSRIGDQLIIEFADYLRKQMDGTNELYGRIESDHFITCTTEKYHERNEKRMVDILTAERKWHSLDYKIYMHAGIYKLEPMDDDIAIACDRATMALQAVKDSYVRRMNYFTREMRDALLLEQEMIREAEMAIENREFFVVYQPIVDSHTREIISAEALIRWKKEDGSLISPGTFVPIFEKNGFITRLDYFVWEEVCRFQERRREAGKKLVPISVNLSRIDFYNAGLFSDLKSIAERCKVDSSLLKIEITESAYMDQPEELMHVIDQFRSYGYKVLMDDFGSGFSSFNMLKDFTVDILKIDMKFMDSIDTSERAGNILYSIIQMAKTIHLEVVAEGVETGNQYEMLKNMDCDCIQGYYFHKPLQAADFAKKLEQNEAELSDTRIHVYDRILLQSKDENKARELLAIMDNQAEITRTESAEETLSYLRRSFSNTHVIMVDYESLPEECDVLIEQKKARSFFSEVPVIIIAKTDNIEETQPYIGNGVIDAVRTPFEKNLVRQRVRRIIDFYGMQVEKRTVDMLKKSVLLRQQLNSFFEDSIAGIARIILENNETLSIRELSYINDRFLQMHMLTMEEAMKAETLADLLPHVRFADVGSFSGSVRDAIVAKETFATKEYDIVRDDRSVIKCIAACSLQYLGRDVKIDIVLLENASDAGMRIENMLSAVCRGDNDETHMSVWQYYIDDDIIDRYRRREDNTYVREILYDAEKNMLIRFELKKGTMNYEAVRDMFARLKAGEKKVSRTLLIPVTVDDKKTHKWYNISFFVPEGIKGKRYAIGILKDLSQGFDLERLLWKSRQYDKMVREGAEFYLEADLTDNRVLNTEAFEILKPYGLPEGFTYDEFLKAFDMTVAEENLAEVKRRVSRTDLIQKYEEGVGLHIFDFMSKTVAVPEWRMYRATIFVDQNDGNGHYEIGMRLSDAESSIFI
ncbi:MAG: bifunctional diguanylate cyclase/phosphodiesterase [Lachnospiraceae bacterium]|nr:bifunctional diguanylate cyclase/phosphodiesterase [Lachnospiraceae bacterium]